MIDFGRTNPNDASHRFQDRDRGEGKVRDPRARGVGALEAIERGRRTDDAHSLEYLYNLYESRIQGYLKNPPPEDWNGAFALLTK